MQLLGYSFLSLVCGFFLDLLLGDPHWMPHPVRLIGWLIERLESVLRRWFPAAERGEWAAGICLVLLTLYCSVAVPGLLLWIGWLIHPLCFFVLESVMCYQILAVTSLRRESMKVYACLQQGNLSGAKEAVSQIVGRDVESLDEAGVIRAAVETVAENASDGVAAPLFYLALGGAPLGFFYKAVNTLDSMVGYKNDRYLNFGRAAAKTDDVMNFLPARICAWLMILCSGLAGLDAKHAFAVFRRDRFSHASPNSAQTESVCAGALHIRLAGDAYYFGRLLKKPYIGDNDRPVCKEDIRRANRLMLCTAAASFLLALGWRGLCFLLGGLL